MRGEKRIRLPVDRKEALACRWRRRDDAPTLLYLHGFGSSQGGEKAELFRRRAMEEELGFFSLDFRGHGESDGDMKTLTLSRCLADVAAARTFLAAEGVERIAVMGSSMGGLVGLWHAALAPEGVLAGLYIAPAVGLAEDLARLVGESGLRLWRESGEIEFENELGAFAVGWGLFEDLADYPTRRLERLHTVPSLLFQGRLDDRVSWRRVAGFARNARGAVRLRLFEDGDHRLIDKGDEMWREMLAFLAAHATIGAWAT